MQKAGKRCFLSILRNITFVHSGSSCPVACAFLSLTMVMTSFSLWSFRNTLTCDSSFVISDWSCREEKWKEEKHQSQVLFLCAWTPWKKDLAKTQWKLNRTAKSKLACFTVPLRPTLVYLGYDMLQCRGIMYLQLRCIEADLKESESNINWVLFKRSSQGYLGGLAIITLIVWVNCVVDWKLPWRETGLWCSSKVRFWDPMDWTQTQRAECLD